MKLHERDKERGRLLDEIERKLKILKEHLHRKMAAPYDDGSTSNMVNAETDVLPEINGLIRDLSDRPT